MHKVTKFAIRHLSDKASRFVPKAGVYPKGYAVGGIHCGVKKDGKSLDLAILQNTFGKNASAAGVFTVNKFKAAPVQVSKKILKENWVRVLTHLLLIVEMQMQLSVLKV
ncbi:ArgJ family protein [Candida albicans]|uniref:ArgJ family protein n=1 Tax=Candida albicans TaxID=5476 RepID=A0A8H6C3H1_CANAX|nr:ArgJ family protein [Candida albicans]